MVQVPSVQCFAGFGFVQAAEKTSDASNQPQVRMTRLYRTSTLDMRTVSTAMRASCEESVAAQGPESPSLVVQQIAALGDAAIPAQPQTLGSICIGTVAIPTEEGEGRMSMMGELRQVTPDQMGNLKDKAVIESIMASDGLGSTSSGTRSITCSGSEEGRARRSTAKRFITTTPATARRCI